MVARSEHLSDLPAQLCRLERGWDRRSGGHHRPSAVCCLPRSGCDLAVPVLHFPDAGFRLRRCRLLQRRSELRDTAGLRSPAGVGAYLRVAGHHRPGLLAYFRSASLVQAEPRGSHQCKGRVVCLGRPQSGRLASLELAVGVRRSRLGLGCAPRAVLSSQFPHRAARPERAQRGRAGRVARVRAFLARARRRRIPGRRHRLRDARSSAHRQPAVAGKRQDPQPPGRFPAAVQQQVPPRYRALHRARARTHRQL